MAEQSTTPAPQDENQIIAERREKLARVRERGIAFPNDFVREDEAATLHAAHTGKTKEDLEPAGIKAALAGRMVLKRVMGKASFATLQDGSGRMQVYLTNEGVGTEVHDAFKHWDLGDILGVKGTMFRTRTGELSIAATEIRLLSKALRPLPEKFHGLTDQEIKYRQRYVDLITNEDTRKTFLTRSRIVQEIRAFMVAKGYLEVETPMMHPIPGGAAARPFATHHNALDMQLFLRIAPELYLKRLVVGGYERVFEINRNFRNEGISSRHNPEFTMMEFYEAYRDYRYLMNFTEELMREVALKVLGTTMLPYTTNEGEHMIDLSKPFDRITVVQAMRKYHAPYASETNAPLHERAFLTTELKKRGVEAKEGQGIGALQLMLFEETVESMLIQPTFIIDYPAETSPLARRNDANPELTDRFELFITGREMANGFSELNDPEDQAARFQEQVKQKDAGDHEAMHYDADYIRALEFGLPPTAGEGIGIDRMVMLYTNSPSIRDVILFPQMRPE